MVELFKIGKFFIKNYPLVKFSIKNYPLVKFSIKNYPLVKFSIKNYQLVKFSIKNYILKFYQKLSIKQLRNKIAQQPQLQIGCHYITIILTYFFFFSFFRFFRNGTDKAERPEPKDKTNYGKVVRFSFSFALRERN